MKVKVDSARIFKFARENPELAETTQTLSLFPELRTRCLEVLAALDTEIVENQWNR